MYNTIRLLSLAFILTVSLSPHVTGANIWKNSIGGSNPSSTNPFTSGQTVDNNMTVSGIGYAGVSPSSGNGRFNTQGWNNSGLDTSRYIYFTLTPDSNYIIDFSSFEYDAQVSAGNGPVNIALRSSLDGFTSNIGSPGLSTGTIDLTGGAYQSLNSSITFRIYLWGASNASGTFSIDDFTFKGALDEPSVFYHKSGDLHDRKNWGHKTNGTGAAPKNFTASDQVFNLRNTATSTTANWTVSGTNSKIVVPSGVTFTIAASHTVSGTIDVQNLGTVNVSWNTTPTFGTLSAGSTVNYNYAGSQNITPAVYYRLVISAGGTKSLQGTTTVNDSLIFSSGKVSLGSYNLAVSGIISGASASNYVIAEATGSLIQRVTAGSDKTFPVGISAAYLPAVIALTGSSTTDNFSVYLINQMRNQGLTGTVMTQNAVDVTWYISEGTTGGSNATITLQWNSSLELTGFDRNACRLGHYTGSAWDYGVADIAATGSNPYSASRSGITSFSPFGMGGGGGALPVTWLGLSGENRDRKNIIYWSTASEWNNDYFEVQSSTDGISFQVAGIVKGSGNSTQKRSYQFTDETAKQLITYYRISQVDYDGKNSFSKTIMIKPGGSTIAVYADPGGNYISVMNADEGTRTEIQDLNGKVLASATTGKGPVNMDIFMLPPGVYLVRNYDELNTASNRTIRFIK